MLPLLAEIRFMPGNAALDAILAAARSGSPIGQTLYNAQFAASRAVDLAAGARRVNEIKAALGLMTNSNGLGQYGMPSMPPRNHTVFFTDENGYEQIMTVVLSERNPMPAVLWSDAQQSEWLATHPNFAYMYDPEVAAAVNQYQAGQAANADPATDPLQYETATIDGGPVAPPDGSAILGQPVNPTHTEPDATILGFPPLAIAAIAAVGLWIYSSSAKESV